MRYLTYTNKRIEKVMIYCDKAGNETSEDIIKAIISQTLIGKFIAKDHDAIDCHPINNDENLFILNDGHKHHHIWQVCGKVSDYEGVIIPHLYRVRKIGVMFE